MSAKTAFPTAMADLVDARIAEVIARAASFPERATSELFVPVPSSNLEDLAPRVRRWLRTAAEDAEAQRALMDRLAANDVALGAGLSTVRLRDPKLLPSWAEALTAFLSAQSVTVDEAPNAALASFERAARASLPHVGGLVEGVEVADEGYRGIVGALVSRLIEVCDPALRFEMQLWMPAMNPLEWPERPEIDATRAGWLARFERFPVLAFAMGVAIGQWRASVVEVLRRLQADMALLRSALFGQGDLGALVQFKAGAGDRHGDGRSVSLLRFSSGKGLVYKPKDLRHVEAMMDLVRFVNAAGLSLPLATRVVVCRDGYGWDERVDPGETSGREGYGRFYRRLGMLMRLMQILNGRDLWADNLLAAGDQPVLIDLECGFTPPLDPPPLLSPRRRALVNRMETTVIRTAMPVQAWLPSPDYPTRDLGCLSHAGDVLPIARYRPWSGAETADPWSHADDVSDGYREMHDVLLAHRGALLGANGPLRAFEGLPMRYIWRSTWDCHKVLRTSVGPMALVDGTARETVLALSFRGTHTAAREAHRPALWDITAAEIDSFRRLDVPMFTSRTTSSSLFTPQGKEIAGHFAGTAMDEVRRRIAALDEVPIASEIAILRSAIDAARGGTELPGASPMLGQIRSDDTEPTDDEVMGAVAEIANLLLDARRPPLGTGGGWLTLAWWPAPDVWEVAPAAADLLSGALGPSLFLADYFALSGDPRAWTAGRDTVEEMFELANTRDEGPPDPRLALGAAVLGGLSGPGALGYAASRVGVSLGDASLLVEAQRYVARGGAGVDEAQVSFDLAFGLAGLLLNLLRVRSDRGADDDALEKMLARLAARLGEIMTHGEGAPNPVWVTRRLGDLVPIDRDAVALALARSVAVEPALVPHRAAVMEALATHAFDLGRRGGRLAAWAVRGCGVPANAPPAISPRGLLDLAEQSTRALVSRAEEAQIAARFGDPDALSESRRCIRVLLDRRSATGRWFPDRLVDDRLNLSALDGVPALGSVLLRSLRPQLPLTCVLE